MSASLIAVVVLPIVGAGCSAWCPRPLRGVVAVMAMLAATVATAMLAVRVTQHGPATLSLRGPGELQALLVADGLAVTMLLMTTVTAIGVAAFALAEDLRGEDRRRAWWPLWLALVASLHVLYLAGDLLTAYLMFEVVGVAAAWLVTLGGGRRAVVAGTRYLYAELAATTIVLVAIAVLWRETGTLVIGELSAAALEGPVVAVALGLLSAGLLLKIPLVPVHLWLPAAHALAPSAVSPLLSAVVVKAAFVMLVRLWHLGVPEVVTPDAAQVLGALGAVAIVWGSLVALRTREVKPLIASSTLAQVGFGMALVPLVVSGSASAWTGGLLYAVAHAPAKAALLLGAAILVRSTGHPAIAGLSGAVRQRPLAVFAVGISAVSLVGLPPTGGFVAKWYLLLGAIEVGAIWWVTLIVVGSLLSAAYLLRLVSPAFDVADEPRTTATTDWRDRVALGLALVTLVVGVRPVELIALLESVAPDGRVG